jgi:hypothetical protein
VIQKGVIRGAATMCLSRQAISQAEFAGSAASAHVLHRASPGLHVAVQSTVQPQIRRRRCACVSVTTYEYKSWSALRVLHHLTCHLY